MSESKICPNVQKKIADGWELIEGGYWRDVWGQGDGEYFHCLMRKNGVTIRQEPIGWVLHEETNIFKPKQNTRA